MAKKCKCPPAGAPEWMMTYGDMMSLLLTFFILLAVFSEVKKDDVFKSIAEEVKRHFGIHGGGSMLPTTDTTTERSLIKILEKMDKDQQVNPDKSHSEDESVEGDYMRVRKVTPGMQFTVGSFIRFEPGSADLNEEAKAQLLAISELVRGYNNKLDVRGHAATGELIAGSRFADLDQLSYARAKVVKDFLASDLGGLRPERMRVIALGDYEPQVRRRYTAREQQDNRRVEIVVDENTVADFVHAGKQEGT